MRRKIATLAVSCLIVAGLAGCAVNSESGPSYGRDDATSSAADPASASASAAASASAIQPSASQQEAPSQTASSKSASSKANSQSASSSASSASATSAKNAENAIKAKMDLTEDFDHPDLSHGEKGAEYQKYIVLHDTEGGGDPESVVSSWDNSDRKVAAHFVVGKDGSVVQCVDLDHIAHHAGFGDTGHNEEYGVEDESRDDKEGAEEIGDWAQDYGMNSYSVGIEMVHSSEFDDDYPEAQLKAVDAVIAYIDAHYAGNKEKSEIIDHKAWRSGNSDTSEAFADYLENYQGKNRTHDGKPFDIASYSGKAAAKQAVEDSDESADEENDESAEAEESAEGSAEKTHESNPISDEDIEIIYVNENGEIIEAA